MAPKKKSEHEELSPPKEEESKRASPVWVYGINDHLEGPKCLPADFKRGATLREDYVKLSELVGAVAHPALKVKPKVQKVPALGRRYSKNRAERGEVKDQATLNVDMTGATQWGGGKPSNVGTDKPTENPPAEEVEEPVLSLRSMLLDRISVHLLGLLLPAGHKVKVLIFSDCRLDVDMLRLLRAGFVSGCPVEALQIEWNPLEVPLPTVEDMEAEEKAKAEEALALAAANENTDGTTSAVNTESVEADMMLSAANHHDLEVRERRRYLIQSQRTLRSFKERLADHCNGSLEAAFEILEAAGDAEKPLTCEDFYSVIEARLGFRGPQVVAVFEVLDGPDYAGSEGTLTLGSMRRALESLPEEVVREGAEDPVGSALAAFVEPSCCLESVSLRASALGRAEFVPIANALKNQPWQLRILNLWDNLLCDRCAEKLGEALEVYRGLEYIGLGQNRITDEGLKSVTAPFNLRVLNEETLKAAQETVKDQHAKIEAKAKAKPRPATANGEREPREPPLYVDDLKENAAEEEGGDSVWVYRRRTELKTLNLSENPIRNPEKVTHLQMIGPEGIDLVLRGCPVASIMTPKRPDLAGPRGRRASGYGTLDGGGWTLRLL
mmetsp:Transcript_27044/g.43285  ORF Transcript_27044/g.43285 Transcript_27044/m.43285 type:complete len:611 (-) Transcript_27044:55-1887(-)|eukprot:CAMPEP_0169070432 /NCGR_PEP_ID=MMETSP1015-20121227/5113_1 /TAXON_ID=342587 /ORGANISM="Karlodinium micrum, Strain CCMP2283" /LENGTH=610 /DNA_ID=CAMNT_0009129431 /DNA_START=58 /DNA_END=1890 /DNA_ORIENTATION=+